MHAQVTRERADSPGPGARSSRAGHRALMVGERWTFLPGDVVVPTPDGVLTDGLAALLARVGPTIRDEGVLILDARAAQLVGLPSGARGEAPLPDGGDPDHPALQGARDAGWSVTRVRAWTTFFGPGRPRIHIGILPLMTREDSPVICTWPHDTLTALTTWHDAVGTPFFANPGVAGIRAIRELADAGKGKRPTFKPSEVGPADAYELAYIKEHFKGPLPDGVTHAGAFDARMGYLAAALVTRLAPFALKPTGKMREYDPSRAGWWRVEMSPWQDKRIPDPAGYAIRPGTRWVAGPTLALVDQLVEKGIHGGYEIRDSMTGPIVAASNGRVLKPWAEKVRDALYSGLPGPGGDAAFVALKQSYSKAWGLLNHDGSSIYRPDWHYAILAQSRANLWRKMWAVGEKLDRWPLSIETDNIWYPMTSEDAVKECPRWTTEGGKDAGIILGEKLGNFQVKGVRELVRRTAK